MKRTWAGEVRNVSLLVAIGVTNERVPRDSRDYGRAEGGQVWLVSLLASSC